MFWNCGIYLQNINQIIRSRIFSQISKCMTENNPSHGEEPDAVEALKDLPVPVGGNLEECRDVATEAEAEKKVA